MKSAAKITSVDVGSVAAAGREKRAVTVRAQMGQPHETLRITVVVPDEGDDAVAREYGVARAKTSLVSSGFFPESGFALQ
jgi:hypothetical protein